MSNAALETEAFNYRPELLQVAETVARDKGIERDEVLDAMEQAIQKAGRSKYGQEHDIRAHIDRSSGAISLARYVQVVEKTELIENEFTQTDLESARLKNENAVPGEFLPAPDRFWPIAAQTAKQVIVQSARGRAH